MHFPIAVITKGKPTEADIEELMAPFQENNMGDVPEEYLEFCPIDDDELQDFQNQYEDATIEKDGQVCNVKEIMSFREYMEDEEHYVYNEETEQYGYYTNPNSRWDWWVIGGRWCAEVVVPVNCDCVIGEKSWGYENENPYECNKIPYKRCDGARIKNISLPFTDEQKNQAIRFWEVYIEGDTPRNEDEKKILENPFKYRKEYYLAQYKTKENYARCLSSFCFYGYLKDGEWVTKDDNGYVGISEDATDEIAWLEKFTKDIIENAESDDWVTIVDCHV